MTNENNRAFRAQCEDCVFSSSHWTTAVIARVEAVGHRDQAAHQTFVEDAGGNRTTVEAATTRDAESEHEQAR